MHVQSLTAAASGAMLPSSLEKSEIDKNLEVAHRNYLNNRKLFSDYSPTPRGRNASERLRSGTVLDDSNKRDMTNALNDSNSTMWTDKLSRYRHQVPDNALLYQVDMRVMQLQQLKQLTSSSIHQEIDKLIENLDALKKCDFIDDLRKKPPSDNKKQDLLRVDDFITTILSTIG